eukprot:gnl/TRDRNA2_/TRDRNA2_94317_c0_seq1.p1 gnl/TRDRNA2_/TRDRNA2_94317_c0~~gnl/TRDRNA2_/TRDRNA2_94317_c0_seq1.p1  ORF type:complete len:231 (+),score=47.71 gnl/TRDRNA2_/TRDRNA2_94317_c0_seq1:46-738(+)
MERIADTTPGNILGSSTMFQMVRVASAAITRTGASDTGDAAQALWERVRRSYFSFVGHLLDLHRRGFQVQRVKRCQNRLWSFDLMFLHGYVVLELTAPAGDITFLRIDWVDAGWELQEEEHECDFTQYVDRQKRCYSGLLCCGSVEGGLEDSQWRKAAVAASFLLVPVTLQGPVLQSIEHFVPVDENAPEKRSLANLASRVSELREKHPRYELDAWNCNHAANCIFDMLA